MNRGELVTEVCDILGIEETDIQPRVQTWLNLTLVRVGRRHFWQDLKSTDTSNATVASTKEYDIVTDWGFTNLRHIHAIDLIDGTNSRKLVYVPTRRLDERRPYPEAYSDYKSWGYTRWGSKIELIDVPDDAYTLKIRYSDWITQFTDDADTCDIDNIDDLLLAATVAWGYASIEDEDSALKWAKIAEMSFQDAIAVEKAEPDYEPVMVGHIMGDAYNVQYWASPFVHSVEVGGE